MFGVLLDVSGSLESAYALDRSHRANVEGTHAIFTTIVNIVKQEVTRHERKESIFVSAFGVQAESAVTCDLLAFLDNFANTSPEDLSNAGGSYLRAVINLAKQNGASHVESWIEKYLSEFEARFLYKAVCQDRELLRKLVSKIPPPTHTMAATAMERSTTVVDFLIR